MNTQRLVAASLLMVLSACKGSCSCGGDDDSDGDYTTSTVGVGGSGGSTSTPTSVGTGGSPGTGGESGTGGDTGSGGGEPAGGVSLRIAHLSPDDASGYDFCLIDAESAEEIGPIEGGDGMSFKDIGNYAGYHSGAYSIRLVAGGAAGCGTPLAETAEPVQLNFGDVVTVAVIGLASADEGDADELTFAIYEDDLSAPEAGNVRARFIHAAPSAPSVDIGYLDPEGAFVELWPATSYPNDAGYVELDAPPAELTLVARLPGSEDTLLSLDIDVTPDTIIEGFAVGLVSGAGAEVVIHEEQPAAAE